MVRPREDLGRKISRRCWQKLQTNTSFSPSKGRASSNVNPGARSCGRRIISPIASSRFGATLASSYHGPGPTPVYTSQLIMIFWGKPHFLSFFLSDDLTLRHSFVARKLTCALVQLILPPPCPVDVYVNAMGNSTWPAWHHNGHMAVITEKTQRSGLTAACASYSFKLLRLRTC